MEVSAHGGGIGGGGVEGPVGMVCVGHVEMVGTGCIEMGIGGGGVGWGTADVGEMETPFK